MTVYIHIEELRFEFEVLLCTTQSRGKAAAQFAKLWDEVNEAASIACSVGEAAPYIALLKQMDRRWCFTSGLQ